MNRNLNNLLVLVAVFLFCSCDDNQLYSEYKTIKGSWNQNEIISFGFKKPKPETSCDLYLNIISNKDYKYNNIFLIVGLEDPKGVVKTDTLEYAMADERGNLLGDGFTDLKENKLWYKERIVFNEDGLYKVHVQQAVRAQGDIDGVQELEGISKIGFRIEKTPLK